MLATKNSKRVELDVILVAWGIDLLLARSLEFPDFENTNLCAKKCINNNLQKPI